MTRFNAEDLELLRLPPDADRDAVERAYRDLRALYAPGSIATYGLFDDEERAAMLARIDDAYQRLIRAAEPTTPAAPAPSASTAAAPLPDRDSTPGAFLRAARERRGVTLDEIAAETKIRRWLLEQIEGEVLANLPATVYVRGFVHQIATLLGVDDPDGLVRAYLARLSSSGETGG